VLYIEGDTGDTWPATVRILAARDHLRMVVQMYEGDDPVPEPFVPGASPQWLETVTTFAPTGSTVSSDLVDVDEDLLSSVALLKSSEVGIEWDFAVYRPGEREWVAAAVPHEGMVFVRDDSLLDELADADLLVSDRPPEWW
jgi:hypothetical protein